MLAGFLNVDIADLKPNLMMAANAVIVMKIWLIAQPELTKTHIEIYNGWTVLRWWAASGISMEFIPLEA